MSLTRIEYFVNECVESYVTTPDENYQYLDYITQRVETDETNVRHYSLNYSVNCCKENTLLIAPKYDFTFNVILCNDETDVSIEFELVGIRSSFITGLQFNGSSISYQSTSNGIKFLLLNLDQLPQNSFVLTLTHIDGFVYTFTFDYGNLPIDCTFDPSSFLIITYPLLPENVVLIDDVNETRLSLNSLFNETLLLSGVYNISIMRRLNNGSNTIHRSYFIDCGLECQVINKLIECRTSDIFNFYDALRYSNNCINVTYEDKCALYELFYRKLNNDGCIDPYEDCDCNGSIKMSNTSFKPNNRVARTKDCGCK